MKRLVNVSCWTNIINVYLWWIWSRWVEVYLGDILIGTISAWEGESHLHHSKQWIILP